MSDESKEKYLELQMLNSQMQQLQQQIQNAEMQSSEMARLAVSIEESKNIKNNQPLLVPLGQGIFLRAKAEEPKEVIMSVGADVVVEKSLDEAEDIVKRQQNELNSIVLDMKHEFSDGVQRLHEIQHELTQMSAEEEPVKKTEEKKKKK